MSLLPLLLEELESYRKPPSLGRMYDQHFGLGLLNEDFVKPLTSFHTVPLLAGYIRPWRATEAGSSGVSTLTNDKSGFKVNLDVQQFKPEDLKVKVVDDYLVVDAKHEERCDQHGFVSRQFTRRYKLPSDVDITALTSKLSSDGVLTLEAPKLAPPSQNSREIPITQTNQPALKESDSNKKQPQPEKMEDN